MGRGLPILAYHALDETGSVISTSPSRFAETMSLLHSKGFCCVSLEDWIAEGRPFVERGFAMTFDDGLESIRRAADVLIKHHFTAMAFLVTNRMGLDNRWPGQPANIPISDVISWDELDQLRSAGFRFGAHSASHRNLGALDLEEIESEMSVSKSTIETVTGMPCRLFAYPYGQSNKQVRKLAAIYFEAAFGMRLDLATHREDRCAISRIDAYYLRNPRVLARLLSCRWSGWLERRRSLRSLRGLWNDRRSLAA